MQDNKLTDNFCEWVRGELQAHQADVSDELKLLDPKKSLTVTVKLKLKHVAGGLFKPLYSLSIPRMAVKSDAEPDTQLQLPGM